MLYLDNIYSELSKLWNNLYKIINNFIIFLWKPFGIFKSRFQSNIAIFKTLGCYIIIFSCLSKFEKKRIYSASDSLYIENILQFILLLSFCYIRITFIIIIFLADVLILLYRYFYRKSCFYLYIFIFLKIMWS